MDRIHYAGDSILTGTEIARALLSYAEALAKSGTSATVDIPVRLDDGTLSRSHILIGPASQLVADTEPDDDGDEIIDEELLARFSDEMLKLKQNQQHRIGRELHPDESDDLSAAIDDY
ncbi:hypothetical protein [Parafrigoribacterium soli]|uniref:hypothetical protein n=1 Tax=Parafrigoribacterium soli TaxID=3144663 RepID=UPI0032EE0E54